MVSNRSINMRQGFWTLMCLICALAASKALADSADASTENLSAESLLVKFSEASRSLNYFGVFTYQHAGSLETFDFVHAVEDGVESEVIQRTNGPEQSFLRSVNAGCDTIGGKLLYGRQLTSPNGDLFGLKHYYRVLRVGEDRIAGRNVWVIQLVPKDELRYGMSLSIDKENYLLMGYTVFDRQKKLALERMQFASMTVTDNADALPFNEISEPLNIPGSRCVGETYSPSGHSPWKPTWLPPGFILTEYSFAEAEGHMETYTDGLHSFSIFVKQAQLPAEYDQSVHQGVSSKGAVTALLSLVPYQSQPLSVSVVGEIPPRVAQRVSLSVTHVKSQNGEGNHAD